MDKLEITPSSLRACAESLNAAAKAINLELVRLDAGLLHLQLGWKGDAAEAFSRARIRACADLDLQREHLAEIAKQALEVADGYGSTDRAAARALGGQE